jgi:hypothetical protein
MIARHGLEGLALWVPVHYDDFDCPVHGMDTVDRAIDDRLFAEHGNDD